MTQPPVMAIQSSFKEATPVSAKSVSFKAVNNVAVVMQPSTSAMQHHSYQVKTTVSE